MPERRTFRKRAAELTKKSVSLLKKLNPEPALSRMKLNRELAKAISGDIIDGSLVEKLVAAGANPNMKSKNKYVNPLIKIAARVGSENLCRLLLEKGANVDAKDKDGNTALTAAARCGYNIICELLIGHGANVEGHNKDGITPLMLAAQCGYEDTCILLIENGANAEVKNRKYGANALMLAESCVYGVAEERTELTAVIILGILLGKDGFKAFFSNFKACIQ